MPMLAYLDAPTPVNAALDYRLLTPGDATCWVPNPELDRLLDLWQSRRRGEALPARSIFSIEDLKPWLGQLAVTQLTGWPPRFRLVLHGTRLVENIGEDWTGRFLEEAVPPEAREVILRPYRDCVDLRVPVFDTLSADTLPKAFAPADRLVLPCAEDGARIDRIITCVLLHRHRPGQLALPAAD